MKWILSGLTFFWRGVGDKFKYHMVKWGDITVPKDFGGLGILDTRLMNIALLGKWIWRLYENREGDFCCQILRKKYLGDKPFSLAKKGVGSQFWKGLIDIRSDIEKGLIFKANNSKSILFWQDVWIQNVPLRLIFPKIYSICRDKLCLVYDCWRQGQWVVDLRRNIGPYQIEEWTNLHLLLAGVVLNGDNDVVTWAFVSSGKYTTKSMYRALSFRGVIVVRRQRLWKNRLPLKIKVFLWLATQDRIPTGVQLKKKQWKGGEKCVLCGIPETTIIFCFNVIELNLFGFVFEKLWGGIGFLGV